MELANNPSIMTGKGIKIGTKSVNTETTNSSASILPNNLKLKDKGLVKSSKILIGNKTGVGSIYLKK